MRETEDVTECHHLLGATQKWVKVKFKARAPLDRILQHAYSEPSITLMPTAKTDLQKRSYEVNLPHPPAHDLELGAFPYPPLCRYWLWLTGKMSRDGLARQPI